MWRNYQHMFFKLLDELYDTPRDKINKIFANQQNKPREKSGFYFISPHFPILSQFSLSGLFLS